MKEFKGKVAVITGAASGIGRGLAERSAEERMRVVLAGINENTLKQAEREISGKGTTTLVVQTDVSKAGDVDALVSKTLDTLGLSICSSTTQELALAAPFGGARWLIGNGSWE